MKFIILAGTLFLTAAYLPAQYNVDSLRFLAQTLPDGLERLNTYKDLAFVHYGQNGELAGRYCDTIEMIAERANLPKARSKAYYFRAAIALVNGDSQAGIEYARTGLNILEPATSREDTTSILNFLNLLGVCYENLGMYEEGMATYRQSGEMALATQDSVGYGIVLTNIGSTQLELLDKREARKTTQYSIAMLQATAEGRQYLSNAYNNLASTYEDSDSILHFLALAEEWALRAQDSLPLVNIYHNRAKPLVRKGRLREALAADSMAIALAAEFGFAELYTIAHLGLGQTYDTLGLRDSAVHYIRRSIELGQEYGVITHLTDAYRHLATIYFELGRADSAYRYTQLGFALNDTLYQRELADATAASAARLSLSEKNRRIAEQSLAIAREKNVRNRLLFIALGLLLLLVCLFQYVLQRNRLRRRELALEVDKREAEAAQLRELDSLKTRFFTNISHELRTPLTLITSPLEEAIGRLKQINLKPDLELAHRNSQNLLTLVNEILDLGKLEAGQLAKNEVAFTPEPTLRRFLYAFESLADLRGVSLAYTGSFAPEERLETDLQKLEKIVNNLVSNALKFSPAGETVTLTAVREKDELVIAVTDQGPGVAPQEQERIFDRYYQSADNAPHQTGTGIGLNLARRLARYLGGDLYLNSTVGKGSTFILRLPVAVSTVAEAPALDPAPAPRDSLRSSGLADASPAAAPEDSIAHVWQATSGQARLLVVEDNLEMAAYLERHLGPYYSVTTAPSGTAALAVLSRETFDLISSDVMMPGMDGFELRERINEREEWRDIPFLLLTARNLEEDVLRGFRLGIDDYVTKPFRLPEYQARINSLLRNRAVRIENQPKETEMAPEDNLVQRAEALVKQRLADAGFTVEEMARELGYGQRQLSRLLSATTGLTPVKFILELRLQKAREMLESGAYATVAEVRYTIGIESASYFSRKFTERFGRNPREFCGG